MFCMRARVEGCVGVFFFSCITGVGCAMCRLSNGAPVDARAVGMTSTRMAGVKGIVGRPKKRCGFRGGAEAAAAGRRASAALRAGRSAAFAAGCDYERPRTRSSFSRPASLIIEPRKSVSARQSMSVMPTPCMVCHDTVLEGGPGVQGQGDGGPCDGTHSNSIVQLCIAAPVVSRACNLVSKCTAAVKASVGRRKKRSGFRGGAEAAAAGRRASAALRAGRSVAFAAGCEYERPRTRSLCSRVADFTIDPRKIVSVSPQKIAPAKKMNLEGDPGVRGQGGGGACDAFSSDSHWLRIGALVDRLLIGASDSDCSGRPCIGAPVVSGAVSLALKCTIGGKASVGRPRKRRGFRGGAEAAAAGARASAALRVGCSAASVGGCSSGDGQGPFKFYWLRSVVGRQR